MNNIKDKKYFEYEIIITKFYMECKIIKIADYIYIYKYR